MISLYPLFLFSQRLIGCCGVLQFHEAAKTITGHFLQNLLYHFCAVTIGADRLFFFPDIRIHTPEQAIIPLGVEEPLFVKARCLELVIDSRYPLGSSL